MRCDTKRWKVLYGKDVTEDLFDKSVLNSNVFRCIEGLVGSLLPESHATSKSMHREMCKLESMHLGQGLFAAHFDESLNSTNYIIILQIVWMRMLICLLYTSPSPRDQRGSRMPSSA